MKLSRIIPVLAAAALLAVTACDTIPTQTEIGDPNTGDAPLELARRSAGDASAGINLEAIDARLADMLDQVNAELAPPRARTTSPPPSNT
jgi:hypothetical protein